MDVLKLAQIKEYLPIQKQAWNKIINMKQGENIPHQGNIIILVAIKDNLTFQAAFELRDDMKQPTSVLKEFEYLHYGSFYKQLRVKNLSESEIPF